MTTVPFTSGQTAALVTTGPGRLMGYQLATQGATTLIATFYDNASAASGTILGLIQGATAGALAPGWYAVGTNSLGIPYYNGIYISSSALGPSGTLLIAPSALSDPPA